MSKSRFFHDEIYNIFNKREMNIFQLSLKIWCKSEFSELIYNRKH